MGPKNINIICIDIQRMKCFPDIKSETAAGLLVPSNNRKVIHSIHISNRIVTRHNISFVLYRMLLWTVLVLLSVINRIAIAGSMLTINVLLNNSVTPELLGTANGFGMTCACVGRSDFYLFKYFNNKINFFIKSHIRSSVIYWFTLPSRSRRSGRF